MTIFMYAMTGLLILLYLDKIINFFALIKEIPERLSSYWKNRKYYQTSGYKSPLGFSVSSLRERLDGITKGFLYGIGFCLAVWWFFPWLYQ